MITYSTNWMGPVSMEWYRQRGLTKTETKTATEDSMFYKVGDVYTSETITTHYSCGRIDVHGIPDEPFGDEIGLSPMVSSDWAKFSDWLDYVETVSVWSLKDLVNSYEQNNPKITWNTHD